MFSTLLVFDLFRKILSSPWTLSTPPAVIRTKLWRRARGSRRVRLWTHQFLGVLATREEPDSFDFVTDRLKYWGLVGQSRPPGGTGLFFRPCTVVIHGVRRHQGSLTLEADVGNFGQLTELWTPWNQNLLGCFGHRKWYVTEVNRCKYPLTNA